ncbi:hypothetical protein [Tissierella sp. Yu-01]|uniref:hypothetical protein n=1 Tax=Tissierella sp. Yu-01 TaxID=3035694 RepID=UPI00240E5920|nr:hypothetical protein [Tissierella sp. Yu-01]WFA07905.1 hypothetical protein P3962_09180 [Tissierella sp. Yu-01]
MGANINFEELLEQRNKSVDNILNNLTTWDGELDSGLEIIKINQEEIDKIDTLNLQLSRFPDAQNEEYIEKIKEIMDQQKKLQESIKEMRQSLLENMQQLSKKNKVIKNYISKNKNPLFIDKDVR